MLTAVDTSLENLDHHGHGTKLEATCMLPSLALTFRNWISGLDFKSQILKYRHSNSYISITRDRDPGQVYKDPVSGNPRIRYTPSKFDRAHALEGVLALAERNFLLGAEELHVCIPGVESFVRTPDPNFSASFDTAPPSPATSCDEQTSNEQFSAWISKVKKAGNAPPAAMFASAHQMGTNRMSTKPGLGVVDLKGRV